MAASRFSSSAPQRSTAVLSVDGDSSRTSASTVSISQSCWPRQKSLRLIIESMLLALVIALAVQQPPVPQPFPRPGTQPSRPAPQSPPPAPAPAAAAPARTDGAPTEAQLGVPIYPGAQFI